MEIRDFLVSNTYRNPEKVNEVYAIDVEKNI